MKLNEKLMDRMRAATRALSGKGPQAATAVIQDALKILQPKHAAPAQPAPAPGSVMRDINPPPAGAKAAPQQAQAEAETAPPVARTQMEEMTETLKNLVPEMMANLDRAGGAGGLHKFKMPDFDLPGGMAGARTPAPALPCPASLSTAASPMRRERAATSCISRTITAAPRCPWSSCCTAAPRIRTISPMERR